MSEKEVIKPLVPTWVTNSFTQLEDGLNGEKSAAIHAVRQQAMKVFKTKGIPTSRSEDWKYTNLSDLNSKSFKLSLTQSKPNLSVKDLEPYVIGAEAFTMVFYNGQFVSELSNLQASDTKEGFQVRPFRSVLEDSKGVDHEALTIDTENKSFQSDNALIALSTSFVQQGVRLTVSKNAVVKNYVNLIYLTDTKEELFLTPRLLIEAAENSELTVVESHIGLSECSYYSAPLTEIIAAANSKVNFHKIGLESEKAYHTSNLILKQSRDSQTAVNFYTFGGHLVRNEARVALDGENGNAVINGLTVISGDQHVDNHTVIDHVKPHCESRETIKGVYDDKSKGVFNGTIIVRQDAQKTNAFQSNQTVLLSKDATIDTKPQLKIWADDVKCTHGATVGQLDEDALFYLRARGIDQKTAKNMLIKAFASDILKEIEDPSLSAVIDHHITRKLKSEF